MNEIKSIRRLTQQLKITFPEDELNFRQFKEFLGKCKFYKYLIPFLNILKNITDCEDVDFEYQQFNNFGFYDVMLMLFFEQIDVSWKQSVDSFTLEKAMDAVINLNKKAYSEIIFQRITHNRPDASQLTFSEFAQFNFLIGTQLHLLKFNFITKTLFDDFSDAQIPLTTREEIHTWLKAETISLWKNATGPYTKEFAFLINKSSDTKTISRTLFIERFYDPCVVAYMEQFSESLTLKFQEEYGERMKQLID